MIDNSQPQRRKVERSAAYPSLNLEAVIAKAQKLYDGLGSGPYTRETAAQAIGYTGLNGRSARTIAAMAHYGLLTRNGNIYYPSELLVRILHPRDEEDRKNSIKEAVFNPKLFSILIKKYAGTALPSLLANVLIQDHKINKNVAKDVVDNFKRSIDFVGLLKNGVVLDFEQKVPTEKDRGAITEQNIFNQSTKKKEGENDSRETKYETPPLPSGVTVIFPNNLKTYFVLGEFKFRCPITRLET